MGRNIFSTKLTLGLFLSLFMIQSCGNAEEGTTENNDPTINQEEEHQTLNLLKDYDPLFEDGDVNAIIEIPAGSTEKWEINKITGRVEREYVDNKPRTINYLGYPGNYGMIPQTLLAKENGGDGDPLDILVLGPALNRESVVKCKVIGVLYLLDRGEQDDKIIAVSEASCFYEINSIAELDENYIGVSQSVETWFSNYKGPGKMESKGYGERESAMQIVTEAVETYQSSN